MKILPKTIQNILYTLVFPPLPGMVLYEEYSKPQRFQLLLKNY